MTIYPYLLYATWVFDDEHTGLKEEAFVFGMSKIITRAVQIKGIANAEQGFAMTFDAVPFDHDVELTWMPPKQQPDKIMAAGNWYAGDIFGQPMAGWLCPALFCYFKSAPKKLYVKAESLPAGIDPIWHISPDDPRATRFMSAEEDDVSD